MPTSQRRVDSFKGAWYFFFKVSAWGQNSDSDWRKTFTLLEPQEHGGVAGVTAEVTAALVVPEQLVLLQLELLCPLEPFHSLCGLKEVQQPSHYICIVIKEASNWGLSIGQKGMGTQSVKFAWTKCYFTTIKWIVWCQSVVLDRQSHKILLPSDCKAG